MMLECLPDGQGYHNITKQSSTHMHESSNAQKAQVKMLLANKSPMKMLLANTSPMKMLLANKSPNENASSKQISQ